jgi:phosphatidylserine/phosphatidylglycerophosphate/cardiolipin synthase-like enzyme
MKLDVKVYDNGDHTAIVWLPSDLSSIPGCRGFAIQRNHNGQPDYLHSFVGFSDTDKFPAAAPWKWPLQRYLWWDYFVQPGDTVKYRVIPVTGSAANLEQQESLASDWTEDLKVTGQCSDNMSAYFNKGIVAAQWVSRDLDKEAAGQNKQTALKSVIQKVGDPLRNSLSGLLRVAILKLLDEAEGDVYAALYELNDPELEGRLKKLGKRLHLILANGAFSSKQPDENVQARHDLEHAGVEVFDRMVSSGHFAHNKFAVFCDSKGQPQTVLTGSTNWTMTGLCTQANNSLIVTDVEMAGRFLDEWKALKAAGNGFPGTLIDGNSQLKQFEVDNAQVTPWFAPTRHQQDLDYARELIAKAKDGILFLFFNPGTYQEDPERETLLQDVLDRHVTKNANYNLNLYIRGVVNQEIAHLTNDGTVDLHAAATQKSSTRNHPPVTLYSGGKQAPQHLSKDVLVPAAIKTRFHAWEEEALRASMVMVHSKVIVLDPFGEHPVLMTGSHNLGVKASQKNDDNLVILEGPEAAPLATAYAINIIAVYQTYRWNSYVLQHQQDPSSWHGLVDNDGWQAGHLTGDSLAELEFWMAEHMEHSPGGGSPAQPPDPAPTRHASGTGHVAKKHPRVKRATAKG